MYEQPKEEVEVGPNIGEEVVPSGLSQSSEARYLKEAEDDENNEVSLSNSGRDNELPSQEVSEDDGRLHPTASDMHHFVSSTAVPLSLQVPPQKAEQSYEQEQTQAEISKDGAVIAVTAGEVELHAIALNMRPTAVGGQNVSSPISLSSSPFPLQDVNQEPDIELESEPEREREREPEPEPEAELEPESEPEPEKEWNQVYAQEQGQNQAGLSDDGAPVTTSEDKIESNAIASDMRLPPVGDRNVSSPAVPSSPPPPLPEVDQKDEQEEEEQEQERRLAAEAEEEDWRLQEEWAPAAATAAKKEEEEQLAAATAAAEAEARRLEEERKNAAEEKARRLGEEERRKAEAEAAAQAAAAEAQRLEEKRRVAAAEEEVRRLEEDQEEEEEQEGQEDEERERERGERSEREREQKEEGEQEQIQEQEQDEEPEPEPKPESESEFKLEPKPENLFEHEQKLVHQPELEKSRAKAELSNGEAIKAVANQHDALIDGQPPPASKEIVDFRVMREHWEEEAKKKTPSGIIPSSYDAATATSQANPVSVFHDESFESDVKAGDAIGDDTSTDNLSGISDPIADLTQSPRKSRDMVRDGSGPRISEASNSGPSSPLDNSSSPEEIVHGDHVVGDVNDERERKITEAHPSSSSAPVTEDKPKAEPSFTDSAAFFKDVKEYWEDGSGDQSPLGASPASTNFFSDDSSGIVHPDADHVIMLEDTDMRPCIAEPELDGEPVFVYDSGSDDENDRGDVVDEGSPYTPTRGRSGEMESRPVDNPIPVQEDASVDTSHLAETWTETRRAEHPRVDARTPSLQLHLLDLPSNASPLPDATPVLATGSILTRSSIRSLVMKKWHQNHWVRYGPTSLYVFRSEDDFMDWLQNPYHSQKQRDYLIKLRLDFYNEMKKAKTRGFKMTDIKVKAYEKKGVPMYNFKLERWSDLGVNVAAAFASADIEEVKAVHAAISHCLEMCPNNGLKPIDDLLVQQSPQG